MADAQVGKLFVKIVPDAEDFQRETARLAVAQGLAMERAMSGSGKRAAAAASQAVTEQIDKVDDAAKASSERTEQLIRQSRARQERESMASAARQANVAAIAAERAARANAATLARLREAEYAGLFDQIEREGQLRARAAEAAKVSSNARGFRLQEEGLAEAALLEIAQVEREVRRIESSGGWNSRLMGDTGRAGRDTEGSLQRAAKSFAFIGGGPLRGVASTLGLVGGQAAVAGGAVAVLGTALVAAAAAAVGIAAGTYAYTKFAASALESAGALEQQQAAFTTMLGSAEEGEAMLRKVAKFAVETPFSTDDVATGAKRLMAYGFAAEDVIPVLTDLGDAAGALGLDGGGMNRLITAFGQIRTTGKLQGDEARQLAENGIPVWEMLAKKMGVTTQEAMKLSSDGLIPAELAIEAIREGIQESFGGGMQNQVNTFTGALEKMRDSVKTGLGLSLMPTLPVLTAEMNQIGDSLLIATTVLGANLGNSLATAFRGAQPAVSEFIVTMSGVLGQIMDEWTPTMTLLTSSLASAFSTSAPAIGAFSAIFSDLIAHIAPQFDSMAQGANKFAQALQSVSQIPGFEHLVVNLEAIGLGLTVAAAITETFAVTVAQSMSVALHWTMQLVDALSAAFSALSSVPGMGWAAGVSEELDGVSASLARMAEQATGVAARSKLSMEVRADITTAEAALSGLAASINTLSPEVLVKYGIDPTGIAQFESEAINNLLGLSPEILATVGIDKATLISEIDAIKSVLDPLGDDVTATINADASSALSAAAAAQQALDNPSLADKLVTITGDPSGAISAVNSANVALGAVQQTQPILLDASTSPLEVKASAAQAILDAVKQYQPAPIDATPAQTALAAQQAQLLIDAVRQNAPILLSADASPTASEAAAAAALIEAVGQGSPIPIEADASPAITEAEAADAAVDAVQQAAPPPIDADPNPSLLAASVAQSAVSSLEGKTVTLNALDMASGQASNVLDMLNRIPRIVSVTINVGTRVSGSVAGLAGAVGQSLAPARYRSGGGGDDSGATPVQAFGPMSIASTVSQSAGAWQIPLSQLLDRLRDYYSLAASVVRDGMQAVYATEYRYYRYLDVMRTNFSRQQEDALEARRSQLEAQAAGLDGDALTQRRAAIERELQLLRRQQDDERRTFEWSLEDRRSYYDEQRKLADAMVDKLASLQDRMRGTVSWDSFLSPSSLIRNLDRNTAILTAYTTNLAQLRAQGLSDEAQAAFSDMDPINAARLAERLLSNPAAIADLNRAYGAFLSAGISGSAAYITPQQIGGTMFAPPPIAASASRMSAGPNVLVDMTVNPSQPMNERQLASAIGSELMWRVA